MTSHGTANDRPFQVAAVVVGLWALFLNFFRLGVPPTIVDEPIYALAGWRYVHGQTFPPGQGGALGTFADNFEHPPLAKYLFGLAELAAGNEAVTPARVVAALASLTAACLMGWWIGRSHGKWTGLALAGSLACTPMIVQPSIVRFGRLGMLDPVAALFMVLALVLCWRWSIRTGRDAFVWACIAGVGAGLAASAKESGFLILIGPALLTMWLSRSSWARLRERLLQAAAMAAAACVTFVASYVPVGHPFARIAHLWDFQTEHARLGHPVLLRGHTMDHPPWWANLWFAWSGLGPVLSLLLAVGLVAALVLVRGRLVAFLGSALLIPSIFFFFFANVTLPFYWVMWMPPAFGMAVLGWRGLLLRVARVHSLPAWAPGTALVAVSILTIGPAASATLTTAHLELMGVQRVATVMRSNGLQGPLITTAIPAATASNYLRGYKIAGTPGKPGAADTIVVGDPVCGAPRDRVMAAFIALNLRMKSIRLLYRDAQVVVYGRIGRLASPGYLDIVSIKPARC